MNSIVSYFQACSKSISKPSYWVYSSFLDTSISYRSNKLGFLWIFLSSLFFVLVLGNLYHGLLGVPLKIYSIHLYFGLVLWNFLNSSITKSSTIVVGRKALLNSTAHVTVFDLVLRNVSKNFIILVHNLIPLLLINIFLYEGNDSLWVLYSILGLFLLTLMIVTLSVTALFIGAFITDTSEFLGAVFRIGFLATPIIWMREKISIIDSSKDGIRFYIDFNPFYHMIELVRAPALNNNQLNSVLVVLYMIVFFNIINSLIYKRFKIKMEKML